MQPAGTWKQDYWWSSQKKLKKGKYRRWGLCGRKASQRRGKRIMRMQ